MIREEVGRPLPIDVASGTSVGALHASALAVWADNPQEAMKVLTAKWTSVSLHDVIAPELRVTGVARLIAGLAKAPLVASNGSLHDAIALLTEQLIGCLDLAQPERNA